ncbi:hypothetical protein CsSME_00008765 [Camellia sinensis var. sinensis]
MDEWLQNPTANSALENIIPRANDQFAQAILTGTKSVSFALVNISNTAITNVYNVQWPPDATPLYFNQSGPLMPLLCNPFNLNLTDRQCQVGEVNFMNATKVWKNYTCQVSTSGICTTPGRLTPMGYNDLTASLNVSYGLYYYSPFLVDLVDSTYLKTTFDDISRNYCPGMRQSTRWIYVGFTVVSAAVMLSLVVDEGRRRKYTSLTIRAYEEGFMKSLSGSIRSTLGLNLDMVINKAHEQNGDMGYGSGVDVQPNGPNQVSSSSNLTLHVKSVKKKGP